MRPKTNLQIFPTLQQLAQAAAEYVARLSAQAIAERGRFAVALSGGSLPKILCPPLVADPLQAQVGWSSWHVFWADERCVPLTDPDSNYRLAREYLFEQVDIPPGQIYPLDDAPGPAAAATAYQARLAEVFQPPAGQRPRFDLILLGMGEDGHTASLFPQHSLLQETERWVAPVFDSPKPPLARITLTLPVINNARQVAFITTGAGKAEALSQVMRADPASPLPAQRVQPATGELHWFVDEAAAAALNIIERI
jgi:6-phosphogluconolactonase